MPEVIRQTLYIDMYQIGIEVAVNQIVNVVQGNSSFTPQHVGFSNLTARLERRPSQPRTANAASRAVVVTRIPSICTGPTTVGPGGSTVSPPPRPSAKRLLASARSASRTTRSCRKKSTRPSPTPSTRPLGRKSRKNDRFKSGVYIKILRTMRVRNVGSYAIEISI
jgi:hypothetical protein